MTEPINTQYLETLLGYNARRATLHIVGHFVHRMAEFELKPATFSALCLIGRNPGITSRQLCQTLNILPPNMVGFLKEFEHRGWITRAPSPFDGRATSLSLTAQGKKFIQRAEKAAQAADQHAAQALSPTEFKTLTRLLKKIHHTAAIASA